jgi:hypothetical protein
VEVFRHIDKGSFFVVRRHDSFGATQGDEVARVDSGADTRALIRSCIGRRREFCSGGEPTGSATARSDSG